MSPINQHQYDAARTTTHKKVPSEPPLARPVAPPMIRVDMAEDGFDMWSEFNDHMAHQGPIEPEDVDRAFELEFYGSDELVL